MVFTKQISNYILWPITTLTLLHRIMLAINGSITDDFSTVYNAISKFLKHADVYNENLATVNPHYLYPPSGTLLLSPFGLINDLEVSRWIFIALNFISIIVGLIFLFKILKIELTSPILPALITLTFLTETVTNTLVFANINGVIFLLEILFIYFFLQDKIILAGLAIGLTFTLKPVLLVLLFLPLITKKWLTIVSALAIPVVTNGFAYLVSQDPVVYFKKTLPYILTPRSYYNSALSGIGMYFGLNSFLILLIRVATLLMVIISLWLSYKFMFNSNKTLWSFTSSGLLLLGEFLIGSLGQGYYSLLLIPFIITVIFSGSVFRNWPIWIGVYLAFSYDNWDSLEWPAVGRTINYLKFTLGWEILIFVTFCVLSFKYLNQLAVLKTASHSSKLQNVLKIWL